jgi:hypothetical protein
LTQAANTCDTTWQDHPQKNAPSLVALQKFASLKGSTNPATLLQRVVTFETPFSILVSKGYCIRAVRTLIGQSTAKPTRY